MGQKSAAIKSAMRSVYMDRLFPKDVKEEMTDEEKIAWQIYRIKKLI